MGCRVIVTLNSPSFTTKVANLNIMEGDDDGETGMAIYLWSSKESALDIRQKKQPQGPCKSFCSRGVWAWSRDCTQPILYLRSTSDQRERQGHNSVILIYTGEADLDSKGPGYHGTGDRCPLLRRTCAQLIAVDKMASIHLEQIKDWRHNSGETG